MQVARKRLSRIEEDFVCRYHFNFIFIGQQAADVIDKLTASEMHEAMLELVIANKLDREQATVRSSTGKISATELGRCSMTKGSSMKSERAIVSCRSGLLAEAKTVYVKLADGSGGELAKIRCFAASSWDSSLPSLKDEQAVRENLFVYLYDDEDLSTDPLDLLNAAFAQMQFQYRVLFNRPSRPPALRATVLRHRSIESGMADDDASPDEALQGFLNKISAFTKYGPMKHKILKTVSFQDPGFVYDAIEDLGRQMSKAALSTSPTTVWEQGATAKSKLCNIL
eukprot:TRINITY_DN25227_c0_g1_i1.p1 TRINITY_DN25227_c0_g1~~TRINITY_DN25227_c0_g1_i1.p1  ORF type:complete len:283 (-),score=61.06 TRINITY_DN25227_c0_g1_i1:53-901(-)